MLKQCRTVTNIPLYKLCGPEFTRMIEIKKGNWNEYGMTIGFFYFILGATFMVGLCLGNEI